MTDIQCLAMEPHHQTEVKALLGSYGHLQNENEQTFVATVDGKVIAVAIKGLNLDQHTMKQVLVSPEFRRQGYGSMLARFVFRQFSGDWQIKVAEDDVALNQFWQDTINNFEYGYYEVAQIIDPVDDMVNLHSFYVE